MADPEGSADDVFMPGGRLRLDLLDDSAAEAVRESVRLAKETRWDCVRSPHVFMGILAVPDPSVHNWGERLGADLPKLLGQFQELFHQEEGEAEAVLVLNREFLSDNVIRLLREAYHRAIDHQRVPNHPHGPAHQPADGAQQHRRRVLRAHRRYGRQADGIRRHCRTTEPPGPASPFLNLPNGFLAARVTPFRHRHCVLAWVTACPPG